MPTRKPEIRALTGIRGVAALLVVVYHWAMPYMSQGSVAFRLFGRGYLFVDLFFVLSGFMMALNYGHLFEDHVRWPAIRFFFLRRFARVYPLYFVVMLALIVFQVTAYRDFTDHNGWLAVQLSHPVREIAMNLFLMQTWGFPLPSIVGQAWSISTETAAYVLFPVLAGLVLRARPAGLLGIILAAAFATAVAAWMVLDDGRFRSGALDIWDGPPALLRCLGGFVIGMVLWRVAGWPQMRRVFSNTFGIAVLGSFVILELLGAPDLGLHALFALLILCLAGNRGIMARLFGSVPVHWLGLVSYAVYLIHPYFARPLYRFAAALQPWLPASAAWTLATVLISITVLGLSTLAYTYVETPARRRLSRMDPRRVGHAGA